MRLIYVLLNYPVSSIKTAESVACDEAASPVKVKPLSCVRLSVTPGTVAHQAPPSMGFPGRSHGVLAAVGQWKPCLCGAFLHHPCSLASRDHPDIWPCFYPLVSSLLSSCTSSSSLTCNMPVIEVIVTPML